MKRDWLKELRKITRWKEIYHLVILPTYKEGAEIIEESIQSIIKANYPKEKMILKSVQTNIFQNSEFKDLLGAYMNNDSH